MSQLSGLRAKWRDNGPSPARSGGRWRSLAACALAATAALSLALPIAVCPAQAASEPKVFHINSNAPAAGSTGSTAVPSDTNPGDGVCQTKAGDCSLRAAIEEANATPADTEVTVTVADGFSGEIVMPSSSSHYMTSDDPSEFDDYAYFRIRRTMTVDLANRLAMRPASDTLSAAGFWIDAPNVKLANLTNVFSNESTVVFSGNSDGSVLEGGTSIQSKNYFAERMALIRSGADNITIRNLTTGRLFGQAALGSAFHIDGDSNSSSVVRNLTISGVTVDNTPASSGGCSASSAGSCAVNGIVVADNMAVHGMVIERSTFKRFPANRHVMNFAEAASSSNWDIRDNTFTEISVGTSQLVDPAIQMTTDTRLTGTNFIRRNTFDNAGTSGQNSAIRWEGAETGANNTAASHVFIEDNYFDGYRGQTVVVWNSGTTTIRRNEFGPNTASQTNTANEETTSQGLLTTDSDHHAMVLNWDDTSNRHILTWYPKSASMNNCQLTVDVAKHANVANSGQPNTPLTLDFYWTAGRTAEKYLGSVEGVAADGATTARVVTPELPPVNSGYLRIQTHGATSNGQPESSQYSRVVAVPDLGTCDTNPAVGIDLRAWTGVNPGEADYASIVGGGGREVPDGGRLPSGEPVYFTYTVTNTGNGTLSDVTVVDSQANPVCVIAQLPRGKTAGCVRRQTAP
ncbi:MAG: hypothetical protein LBO20_11200 [Bifidobacteriaceae bacterium]|jgi:hypothetical protein|nr:hypothetical protein [Bifidobacteriaceae bacterium]